MRLLIQSMATGRFLVSGPDGVPMWVSSLRQAGGGVCVDLESVQQLLEDNTDLEDAPVVIDLDRLGTEDDYTDSLLSQGNFDD